MGILHTIKSTNWVYNIIFTTNVVDLIKSIIIPTNDVSEPVI